MCGNWMVGYDEAVEKVRFGIKMATCLCLVILQVVEFLFNFVGGGGGRGGFLCQIPTFTLSFACFNHQPYLPYACIPKYNFITSSLYNYPLTKEKLTKKNYKIL